VSGVRRVPGQLVRAHAGVSWRPGSLGARVRIRLDSFLVQIDGHAAYSSTTIASVGAYVVVVATTLPEQVLGLTSCYLGQPHGALAASHLRLGPQRYEHLHAHVLPQPLHVAEHARACLLDHATELQHTIAELTGAHVLVDIPPDALKRASQAWEPGQGDT
jgi:hypothetical protein